MHPLFYSGEPYKTCHLLTVMILITTCWGTCVEWHPVLVMCWPWPGTTDWYTEAPLPHQCETSLKLRTTTTDQWQWSYSDITLHLCPERRKEFSVKLHELWSNGQSTCSFDHCYNCRSTYLDTFGPLDNLQSSNNQLVIAMQNQLSFLPMSYLLYLLNAQSVVSTQKL